MSILTLRPNAVGDETSITLCEPTTAAHWETVDEAVADDVITYLNETSVSYKRDLFNLPNHTTEAGTINFIKIYIRGKRADAGSYYSWGKPSQKSGTTVTDGTEVAFTTSWATYSETYTTNPATGAAYTWAKIDALQIGVLLKTTAGSNSLCTQVYVEVDYTASIDITITLAATADATGVLVEPTLNLISNPTITLATVMDATGAVITPIGIVQVDPMVMTSTGTSIEPTLSLSSIMELAAAMAATGDLTEPTLSLSSVMQLIAVMASTGAEISPATVVQADMAAVMASIGAVVSPSSLISAIVASTMNSTGATVEPTLSLSSVMQLISSMAATGSILTPNSVIQAIIASVMAATEGKIILPSITTWSTKTLSNFTGRSLSSTNTRDLSNFTGRELT